MLSGNLTRLGGDCVFSREAISHSASFASQRVTLKKQRSTANVFYSPFFFLPLSKANNKGGARSWSSVVQLLCLGLSEQFESRQASVRTPLSEEHAASFHAVLLSDLNLSYLVKPDALLHHRGQKQGGVRRRRQPLTAGVISKLCAALVLLCDITKS